MKITEEQRKILNDWLDDILGTERTFTTWTDFGAVVEKLKEKNQFSKFIHYLYITVYMKAVLIPIDTFFAGIFDPERFCILVAEVIKEGAIK